jgi:AhpD family alkylhydroperoxidase
MPDPGAKCPPGPAGRTHAAALRRTPATPSRVGAAYGRAPRIRRDGRFMEIVPRDAPEGKLEIRGWGIGTFMIYFFQVHHTQREYVKEFNRRIYHSFSAFFVDLKAIMAQRDQMKSLMRGETMDAAFRERLMLAVTAVNGCRYCSYAHARQALAGGIHPEEVKALQDGVLENSPGEELPALLYAQHWAETGGRIDPVARERMIEAYDQDGVNAVELALRTIQMGNLLGNTMDYVLYRLSFGRWGGPREVGGA